MVSSFPPPRFLTLFDDGASDSADVNVVVVVVVGKFKPGFAVRVVAVRVVVVIAESSIGSDTVVDALGAAVVGFGMVGAIGGAVEIAVMEVTLDIFNVIGLRVAVDVICAAVASVGVVVGLRVAVDVISAAVGSVGVVDVIGAVLETLADVDVTAAVVGTLTCVVSAVGGLIVWAFAIEPWIVVSPLSVSSIEAVEDALFVLEETGACVMQNGANVAVSSVLLVSILSVGGPGAGVLCGMRVESVVLSTIGEERSIRLSVSQSA